MYTITLVYQSKYYFLIQNKLCFHDLKYNFLKITISIYYIDLTMTGYTEIGGNR